MSGVAGIHSALTCWWDGGRGHMEGRGAGRATGRAKGRQGRHKDREPERGMQRGRDPKQGSMEADS